MCKYTWFRDNSDLYSIWEAIIDWKNEFLCHFLCNSERKWWVLVRYGDIWMECFHKGNMVFMSQYICFWDTLDLYNIGEAIVNKKNEFSCPFFGQKIFGQKFFSAKFFFLWMLQFAKKSCFWKIHFLPNIRHFENFSLSDVAFNFLVSHPPPGRG